MGIRKVLITSQSLYLDRFQHLFEAMSQQLDVQYMPLVDMPFSQSYPEKLNRKTRSILHNVTRLDYFQPPKNLLKTPRMFVARSKHTEEQIRQLEWKPELIFHVFCLSSPLWKKFDIPYVMFLDYTMALSKRNWSVWATFCSDKECTDWLDYEYLTYQCAQHLFCVSNHVKTSLVEDYKIPADKVTVTGSSANFASVYEGRKTFGSQRILFNGSDFERKGGDLVLAAFRQVKGVLPNAKLSVIGAKLPIEEDGVEILGHVQSRENLQQLLLRTDLLAAPARCDPFPVLPMEAMNFGVPCIVSACDGNPDIVDDSVNGVVLPDPTVEQLVEKMIDLLRTPEKLMAMSKQAQYKIKTKLNWNSVAQTITHTLSELY